MLPKRIKYHLLGSTVRVEMINCQLSLIEFDYDYQIKKHSNNEQTMFDRATPVLGTINLMSNVAFIAGSSQQGKALRASVAFMK